jgi:hypothetical protein
MPYVPREALSCSWRNTYHVVVGLQPFDAQALHLRGSSAGEAQVLVRVVQTHLSVLLSFMAWV